MADVQKLTVLRDALKAVNDNPEAHSRRELIGLATAAGLDAPDKRLGKTKLVAKLWNALAPHLESLPAAPASEAPAAKPKAEAKAKPKPKPKTKSKSKPTGLPELLAALVAVAANDKAHTKQALIDLATAAGLGAPDKELRKDHLVAALWTTLRGAIAASAPDAAGDVAEPEAPPDTPAPAPAPPAAASVTQPPIVPIAPAVPAGPRMAPPPPPVGGVPTFRPGGPQHPPGEVRATDAQGQQYSQGSTPTFRPGGPTHPPGELNANHMTQVGSAAPAPTFTPSGQIFHPAAPAAVAPAAAAAPPALVQPGARAVGQVAPAGAPGGRGTGTVVPTSVTNTPQGTLTGTPAEQVIQLLARSAELGKQAVEVGLRGGVGAEAQELLGRYAAGFPRFVEEIRAIL